MIGERQIHSIVVRWRQNYRFDQFFPLLSWSGAVTVSIGEGFEDDIAISSGNIALSYSNREQTQIIITLPALPLGRHKVRACTRVNMGRESV